MEEFSADAVNAQAANTAFTRKSTLNAKMANGGQSSGGFQLKKGASDPSKPPATGASSAEKDLSA
jgi:hypothetical protein